MRETSPHSGDSYRSGDYYMVCAECGLKFRRSEVRKRWDGNYVCLSDWEPRHPQDTPWPMPRDKGGVPVARPEPTDVYLAAPVTQDDL